MENEVVGSSESELVLTALEARVVGCLMEKEATMPDVYPLSLSSLVRACQERTDRA